MTISDPNFLSVPNDFWTSSKKLTLTERLLYLFLASMCYGDKNVCWPTQDYIAEKTGIALRTIKANIKSLTLKGVISIGRASDYSKETDTRQIAYILMHWDKLNTVEALPRASHQKKGAPNAPITKDKNRCPKCTNIGAPNALRLVPQMPTNNTIQEDNTITQIRSASPRGASPVSGATDRQDQPNALEGNVLESSKAWIYKHKPKQLIKKTFATDQQLKNAIYGWFSAHTPEPFKFRKELDKATNTKELAKAFRYINYWNEYGCGRKSLNDFIQNAARFAQIGEDYYCYDTINFCRDNRERLVADFIRENNLYDITQKANRDYLKRHHIKGTNDQIRYYNAAKTLFVVLDEDGNKRLREYQNDGEYNVVGGEYFDDLSELTIDAFTQAIEISRSNVCMQAS